MNSVSPSYPFSCYVLFRGPVVNCFFESLARGNVRIGGLDSP